MHQQRRPTKRFSSYVPSSETTNLEDSVMLMPANSENPNCELAKNQRSSSTGSADAPTRRKSLSTLHFDALQNAVSQLARIDDFHLEELGYGFFSDVFKVTHKQSGKIMVLKRNKNTNTKMNILREVQLMNRLSHPNILKFNGVCVHEGQLHGLTEFINGGDLDQFVQKLDTPVSWVTRVRLALDVSSGVKYLNSLNIFHRDLTAKNCLIRETQGNNGKTKYSALVADLGLAEKIPSNPEEEKKLKMVGTPYYMAPEVLTNKPYNEFADIFSFGIILCQLIIRTSSDPEKLPRSNDFGIARDLLLAMVKKGDGAPLSPSNKPIKPPNSFLQLAFDCGEVDPTKRPCISKVVQVLQKVLSDLESEKRERKRLENEKYPTSVKRHSTVLSELPSLTGDCTKPCEKIPHLSANGPNKENESNSPSESSISPKESSSKGTKRRYSESRLSRSYSDISSEIISHARSIIASSRQKVTPEPTNSDMDTVIETINEAFLNPFDMFDISEDQGKLIDEPSSDVLEMTFDLPTPKQLPGSPARVRRINMRHRYGRRRSRPRSLSIDEHGIGATGGQGSGKSTPDSCPVHGLPSSSPQSPISPEPPQTPKEKGPSPLHTKLKQAVMRSIALSPQGCRLQSWWHGQGRGSDKKSISSIFSLMSDKYTNLQRSISLPNVAMMRENVIIGNNSLHNTTSPPLSANHQPTLQYGYQTPPAYATLPRKKSRNVGPLTMHKQRSSTADDVFQDVSQLEILTEECQATQELSRTAPPISTKETVFGLEVGVEAQENDEINNNVVGSGMLDASKKTDGPEVFKCPGENRDNKPDPDTMNQSRALKPLHTPSYSPEGSISSSSSSGASSSGLKITLKSGVICSNRRKKMSPTVSHPLEENVVTPKSNRDSGYNEDLNISDHSHPYVTCDPYFHTLPTTIETTSSMDNEDPSSPKHLCTNQKHLDLEGSMSDLTLMAPLLGSRWKVANPKNPQKQLVHQMR